MPTEIENIISSESTSPLNRSFTPAILQSFSCFHARKTRETRESRRTLFWTKSFTQRACCDKKDLLDLLFFLLLSCYCNDDVAHYVKKARFLRHLVAKKTCSFLNKVTKKIYRCRPCHTNRNWFALVNNDVIALKFKCDAEGSVPDPMLCIPIPNRI